MDDSILIQKARQGDGGAVRELYQRHAGRVYAVVKRLAGHDDALAEDWAQEAWVRAIRALPTFRGDARFTTWLHRIAVNSALHGRRSRMRKAGRETAMDDRFSVRAAAETSVLKLKLERAMERRLAAMYASPNEWAAAIVASIWKKGEKNFRWHDSGDLQGMNHLMTIVAIAEELEEVQFWLPTREYGIVRDYLRKFKCFPSNLTVRVSAPMIGAVASEWAHSSSIDAVHTPLTAWVDCPASKQGNKCMECRACWAQDVEVVNYKKHYL